MQRLQSIKNEIERVNLEIQARPASMAPCEGAWEGLPAAALSSVVISACLVGVAKQVWLERYARDRLHVCGWKV